MLLGYHVKGHKTLKIGNSFLRKHAISLKKEWVYMKMQVTGIKY